MPKSLTCASHQFRSSHIHSSTWSIMGEGERMWNNGKKRMLTLGRGFEARSRPKCNNKGKSFLSPLLAFAGFVANRRTNTIRDVVFANGRHFPACSMQCIGGFLDARGPTREMVASNVKRTNMSPITHPNHPVIACASCFHDFPGPK